MNPERMLGGLAGEAPAMLAAAVAIAFVGLGYFAVLFDRRRENSPSKDDTQVGIKLVLYGLILAGIGLTAQGATLLLAFVLGGFKGGGAAIKISLPPILVGVGTVFVVMQMLLPRTNSKTASQVERFAAGFLGIIYGVQAISGLNATLSGLFTSAPWGMTAAALAGVLVNGGIAFVAVTRLGSLSSWTMPVRPAAPMPPAGYPPQGGGYPPQQGGYPPQQGGYPPQQGGYPPQGGGYPPQGGGYPPQGGGYPPR
jgi:hypothetical protein